MGALSIGRNAMKIKNIAYAVVVAATAAMFVIASAVPSEAAKKKRAKKVAAPQPSICFNVHKPVCAVKGNMRFTYANSCYAVNDGAKVVSQKACKAPGKAKKAMKKAMKPKAKKG
jgi:hypothetical protein